MNSNSNPLDTYTQIATIFNQYFSQIKPSLARALPEDTSMFDSDDHVFKTSYIYPINENTVLKEIVNLDAKEL